jgi:hypothetical protein
MRLQGPRLGASLSIASLNASAAGDSGLSNGVYKQNCAEGMRLVGNGFADTCVRMWGGMYVSS